MRHGRAKAARKTLQFFARQGIHAPYCVLVDGTFLVQAMAHKVPIVERIEKLLQHATFTLHITRSSLQELELLAQHAPERKRDSLLQARQWGLDECEVVESRTNPNEPIHINDKELGVPSQDIFQLVQSQAHSYVVATQDETLLDVIRNAASCPLIRLSRGVLLLENPSKVAQQRAHYHESQKYSQASVKPSERLLAQSVREVEEQKHSPQQPQQHARIKRKAKGPNPLSCKKKKTETPKQEHKRKRRRKNKTTGESDTT